MKVVLTYEDYAALPNDGKRYEILDGEGAPTLVVEVLSPATIRADRTTKLQLYARYRVPYFWIVDPERRVIEVYRLAGGGYGTAATFGDELTDVPPFDGLRLDPASLWVR